MNILALFCGLLLLVSVCLSENCVNVLKADIYILSDSSGSIAPNGWIRSLNFTKNLALGFPLGPDAVQIGFGIFSTSFVHISDVNKYTDPSALAEKLLGITQLKQGTKTDVALDEINNEGYLKPGKHGCRYGVGRYAIVITDGQSEDTAKTLAAADRLRASGVVVFCIGVGLTNLTEIEGIAGKKENVFSVKTFGAIEEIRGQITQRVCTVSQETTPVPSTTTTIAPSTTTTDKATTAPTTTTAKAPPTTTPKQCNQTDLCSPHYSSLVVFLVSSSSGVKSDEYKQLLQFVYATIKRISQRAFTTKFALITYGAYMEKEFDFTADVDVIIEKLESAHFHNSTQTITARTLRAARCYLRYCEGCSLDFNRVVVLVTDRPSDDPTQTLQKSQDLQEDGITVVALGIKPTSDQTEVTKVASALEFSFQVNGYSDVLNYAGFVSSIICKGKPYR